MLADLLDKLAVEGVGPDDGAPLADARAVVAAAAEDAVLAGGWSPNEPLRLTKNRVRWLLHCPRRAVSVDDRASGSMDDLLLGLVVDAAAKLLALGAARPVTADTAVDFLRAQGDDQVADHLAELGESVRADLLDEAATRLRQLDDLWPAIEPEWWPRVEEPVRVPLADRAILLSGRLDILLGGPPTDRPAVLVEIKGGRWHDSARSETHFYSLLLGLRDGTAPSHVVSLAAADGATHVEEVRPAVLSTVARQIATAIDAAGSIAAGEVPEARPGAHCSTCPARSTCPAATVESPGVATARAAA